MNMISRNWFVNGTVRKINFLPSARLLDVLRDELRLTGAKEGCAEGECGACTVLVEDSPVVSCLLLAVQLPDETRILTIEGVSREKIGQFLQQAFVDVGAVQCGFCIPGMILAAYALLKRNTSPSDGEIRKAMSGNLCRCTGYAKIIAAVKLAAQRLEGIK